LQFFQVAASLRNGSQSVTELCEACLRRMNRTAELNAFITEVPEVARQAAAQAQERISNG
jgi:Asp-tRNA(Asn)/Glu-tRNA(Gln) amidotransferase A subunit family amidase